MQTSLLRAVVRISFLVPSFIAMAAGSRPTRRPDQAVTIDLETVDGRVLPKNAKTQLAPIAGLSADWSQFVDHQGNQRQTVGHHFSRSRPLNELERSHVERTGICLSCHRELPAGSPAMSLLHHVAKYTGRLPKTAEQHDSLVHKIVLFAGWGQVLGGIGIPATTVAALAWCVRRRRRRRCQSDEWGTRVAADWHKKRLTGVRPVQDNGGLVHFCGNAEPIAASRRSGNPREFAGRVCLIRRESWGNSV